MKKYNLLIPIAGKGSRFTKEKYILPKPLILIDHRSIIEWTMSCVDYSECNVIFVVRKEHVVDFNIDGYLRNRFGADIVIVQQDGNADGAICSCLLAKQYIDNDLPLFIHCSDIYFEEKFKPYDFKGDGLVLTFKSNSTNYSYVETDNEHNVVRTAEKQVISSDAAVGLYGFKSGKEFVDVANEMIARNVRVNNEFYICPIYNIFVERKKKILTAPVDKMHIFGTPEELDFFVKNSLRSWPQNKRTIALCCDHSGFEAKENLKFVLKHYHPSISCLDFGVYDKTIDRDYFEYVHAATNAVLNGSADLGIGFCRSGQGVNICANKVKGIRSAWVHDEYLAQFAVKHGCCNFFAIPAHYAESQMVLTKIIDAILCNTFDGGRHQVRISKLES